MGKFLEDKGKGYVKADVLALLRYTANRCAEGYLIGEAWDQALRDYYLYGPDWNQADLQYQSDYKARLRQLQYVWNSEGAGMSQAGSMLLNVLVDYQAVEGAQDADVIKASAVPRIRPLNVPLLEHADWS